ncbi:hypothetical protein FXO38_22032 [Capsicum annuum]|nr:hypothetical protein FXO38_22032 [Capsicum annuum]
MDELKPRPPNSSPLTPLTFLERAATIYANCPSVVYNNNIRYTWSQTRTRCLKIASSIASLLGIHRNHVVSVVAPNVPAMYELSYDSKRKMTTDSQMHDAGTTMSATSIATMSRTNALQVMAPAEEPGKFTGIDFKRWQQKMFFYLITQCFQRFTVEEAPKVPEGTSEKERFVIVEA